MKVHAECTRDLASAAMLSIRGSAYYLLALQYTVTEVYTGEPKQCRFRRSVKERERMAYNNCSWGVHPGRSFL